MSNTDDSTETEDAATEGFLKYLSKADAADEATTGMAKQLGMLTTVLRMPDGGVELSNREKLLLSYADSLGALLSTQLLEVAYLLRAQVYLQMVHHSCSHHDKGHLSAEVFKVKLSNEELSLFKEAVNKAKEGDTADFLRLLNERSPFEIESVELDLPDGMEDSGLLGFRIVPKGDVSNEDIVAFANSLQGQRE